MDRLHEALPTLSKLRAIQVSDPSITRTAINKAVAGRRDLTPKDLREILEIGQKEHARIGLMIETLEHPNMEPLVDAGNISFGMIKPHRDEAIWAQGTDEEVADQVIAAIRPPLDVAVAQPIWIPSQVVRSFYGHLPEPVITRLEGFMSGGATTALLLHEANGNAVNEWRSQMGSTRAHANTDEAHTLRYRFRTPSGVENNVAHGSDSIESVKRELAFFKERLSDLIGA